MCYRVYYTYIMDAVIFSGMEIIELMKLLFLFVLFLLLLYILSSCGAYGHTNRRKRGSDISFHRFLHKHPELLMKLSKLQEGTIGFQVKMVFICSTHFTDSCFHVMGKSCQLESKAVS